ncbi:hypothetical protein [Galbibacter orientalis]|uniref:hypothetical protein n=1 Tax=Galbibacter orientalis TaxID=453852 RepID=UPI0030805EE6
MTYAYLCDDENIKHLKLDDKLELISCFNNNITYLNINNKLNYLWCDGNVKLSNFNFNQKIHMYYE